MPKTKDAFVEVIHRLITGLFIPILFFIFGEIGDIREELKRFQVQVAKESAGYVTKEDIVRIEQKIDDLRNLVITEIKKK